MRECILYERVRVCCRDASVSSALSRWFQCSTHAANLKSDSLDQQGCSRSDLVTNWSDLTTAACHSVSHHIRIFNRTYAGRAYSGCVFPIAPHKDSLSRGSDGRTDSASVTLGWSVLDCRRKTHFNSSAWHASVPTHTTLAAQRLLPSRARTNISHASSAASIKVNSNRIIEMRSASLLPSTRSASQLKPEHGLLLSQLC